MEDVDEFDGQGTTQSSPAKKKGWAKVNKVTTQLATVILPQRDLNEYCEDRNAHSYFSFALAFVKLIHDISIIAFGCNS